MLYVWTECRIKSAVFCVECEQFPNISMYAITVEYENETNKTQKKRRKMECLGLDDMQLFYPH